MRLKKYNKFIESAENPNDMWDYIPKSVKELHTLFKHAGKKLFVVGGSVRDFLNNERPKDFDIATDALPEEVVKIIGNRWKVTLQGKSFFVVVVYTEDEPNGMEIATFRSDDYGDLLGKTRNPNVKYSTIKEDSERRDITWNSLYYDLDTRSIIDLVGGIEDMKNKVTKFVGDPDMRIMEDPLRILRILRFTARYDFVIDDKTYESILKNKKTLDIITKERIWEEFHKAFKQCKDFTKYLRLISELNLWSEIFPGVEVNTDFVKSKNFIVVIANIFRNANTKNLSNTMIQKFKIPDVAPVPIARQVIFLIEFLKLTPDNAFDLFKLKERALIKNDTIQEWIRVNGGDKIQLAFLEYKPSVSAEELMAKGLKGGPLGQEIKRLETEKFKSLINDNT